MSIGAVRSERLHVSSDLAPSEWTEMTARVGFLVFLVAFALAGRAAARERLAVLIAAERDPGLADNLTEVAIAAAAETPGSELVGRRELRGRVAELAEPDD